MRVLFFGCCSVYRVWRFSSLVTSEHWPETLRCRYPRWVFRPHLHHGRSDVCLFTQQALIGQLLRPGAWDQDSLHPKAFDVVRIKISARLGRVRGKSVVSHGDAPMLKKYFSFYIGLFSLDYCLKDLTHCELLITFLFPPTSFYKEFESCCILRVPLKVLPRAVGGRVKEGAGEGTGYK